MSQELKLKPCPFCGGIVELMRADKEAFIWLLLHADGNCILSGHVEQYEDEQFAISDWNTRSREDALEFENARLREALEKIVTLDVSSRTGTQAYDHHVRRSMSDIASQALKSG